MTQTLSHPTDLELKNAVCEELAFTPSIDGAHIGVYVIDGSVTLSGEVHTYPEQLLAEKAAQRVRGVTAVTQRITVNATRRHVEDSDLVQEVSESLERAVDVPKSLSVTVKDGVITLSGEVQWQFEREAAIRSVRYLRGVLAVHSLITIEPSATASDLDAAITSALVRSAQLEGKKITVTTDRRGCVTLTGAVDSWSDRRQAEHACWAAAGVTSVDNQLRLPN